MELVVSRILLVYAVVLVLYTVVSNYKLFRYHLKAITPRAIMTLVVITLGYGDVFYYLLVDNKGTDGLYISTFILMQLTLIAYSPVWYKRPLSILHNKLKNSLSDDVKVEQIGNKFTIIELDDTKEFDESFIKDEDFENLSMYDIFEGVHYSSRITKDISDDELLKYLKGLE